MTSNHTQLKQFSFTDSVRTSDSPRFASLPQYTGPKEPYAYYLSKPFLSQSVAQLEIGVRKPNRYLRLMPVAKANGLPQARHYGLNIKYLLIN